MPLETRFGEAVAAYAAYRPEYPAELWEKILAGIPPEHRQRAVDLGAGTGLSAVPLAQWFREVIAVEPDAKMAAALARRSARLEIRETRAEECVFPPSSVDLVTSGHAFHWMDGPRVIELIAGWLRPQGIFAQYGGPFPHAPDAVKKIIRREFDEHWDQYRSARLRGGEYARRAILDSPLLRVLHDEVIPTVRYFTPHDFVGYCSSTSYGAAYIRSLSDPAAYLANLEREFRAAHPGERIPIDFKLELIQACRA